MAYEVNSSGRADPVPGTETPDDPKEDWREPWTTDAHPEWTDDER